MTKCFRLCRNDEIDMIFYAGRNPDLAEKKRIYTYKHSLDLQPDGGNR